MFERRQEWENEKRRKTNFICKRAWIRREMRVNGQVCRLLFRCDIMDKSHKSGDKGWWHGVARWWLESRGFGEINFWVWPKSIKKLWILRTKQPSAPISTLQLPERRISCVTCWDRRNITWTGRKNVAHKARLRRDAFIRHRFRMIYQLDNGPINVICFNLRGNIYEWTSGEREYHHQLSSWNKLKRVCLIATPLCIFNKKKKKSFSIRRLHEQRHRLEREKRRQNADIRFCMMDEILD